MEQVVNGAVLCSIYVLFSLGLSLTWGILDKLNLAHGAVMMSAAFFAYLITEHWDAPLAVLFAVGICGAGLLTLVFDVIVLGQISRSASGKQHNELRTLIAGIGVNAILVTIAQRHTIDSPFGIGHLDSHIYVLGGAKISVLQIWIIVLAIALCIIIAVWTERSQFGRGLRAIAHDAEIAELMGIRTRMSSAVLMFVSGALAGLAGMLLVMYLGALTPESGDSLLLKGFAIIILGAVGSIWGTLLGSAILAAAETIVVVQTSGTWVEAIAFGIILIVILVRPQGIFARGTGERV